MLIDHTVPELDFILEMASIEEPDRWVFARHGKQKSTQAMANWVDVLKGAIGLKYLAKVGLVKGIENVAAFKKREQQRGGGLKPGLTRGGKPIAGDQDRGSDPA